MRIYSARQLYQPQAIICILEATDLENAIRDAISLGGDSDIIACIAGAIAEARFGISIELIAEASSRLSADMRVVMDELYASAA